MLLHNPAEFNLASILLFCCCSFFFIEEYFFYGHFRDGIHLILGFLFQWGRITIFKTFNGFVKTGLWLGH